MRAGGFCVSRSHWGHRVMGKFGVEHGSSGGFGGGACLQESSRLDCNWGSMYGGPGDWLCPGA